MYKIAEAQSKEAPQSGLSSCGDGATLLKALAAKYWPTLRRPKWHSGLLAALRADGTRLDAGECRGGW